MTWYSSDHTADYLGKSRTRQIRAYRRQPTGHLSELKMPPQRAPGQWSPWDPRVARGVQRTEVLVVRRDCGKQFFLIRKAHPWPTLNLVPLHNNHKIQTAKELISCKIKRELTSTLKSNNPRWEIRRPKGNSIPGSVEINAGNSIFTVILHESPHCLSLCL